MNLSSNSSLVIDIDFFGHQYSNYFLSNLMWLSPLRVCIVSLQCVERSLIPRVKISLTTNVQQQHQYCLSVCSNPILADYINGWPSLKLYLSLVLDHLCPTLSVGRTAVAKSGARTEAVRVGSRYLGRIQCRKFYFIFFFFLFCFYNLLPSKFFFQVYLVKNKQSIKFDPFHTKKN